MSVRYLKPRTANHSSRVELLMKLWDSPLTPAEQERLARVAPVTQRRSEFGNLNNEGTPYPSQSCLLTRFHPDFESVVEPGVKQLLFVMVIEHNLVTYTSCEGHYYKSTDRPHDERHVGVIPRDTSEHKRVLALCEDVARAVNSQHAGAAVEVTIMDHTVRDGDKVYPAVDLYLSRCEGHTWAAYFAELDTVCNVLVDALLARTES